MPVLVPLIDLVSVANTSALWPPEVRAADEKLGSPGPNDRAAAGELADWLEEIQEVDLAAGFRYLANRPDVAWQRHPRLNSKGYCWVFVNLPPVLVHTVTTPGVLMDDSTVMGLVAQLSRRIRKAKEDLQ